MNARLFFTLIVVCLVLAGCGSVEAQGPKNRDPQVTIIATREPKVEEIGDIGRKVIKRYGTATFLNTGPIKGVKCIGMPHSIAVPQGDTFLGFGQECIEYEIWQ